MIIIPAKAGIQRRAPLDTGPRLTAVFQQNWKRHFLGLCLGRIAGVTRVVRRILYMNEDFSARLIRAVAGQEVFWNVLKRNRFSILKI